MQALTVMLTGHFKGFITTEDASKNIAFISWHNWTYHLKQRDKLSNTTLKHPCCMCEIRGEGKTQKL